MNGGIIMEKIYAKDLIKYKENEIKFQGFVDNIKDLKYVQFLILKNSTGKLQVTIEKNEENKCFNELISNLSVESTIEVSGKLKDAPNVKLGGVELVPNEITVLSNAKPLPIKFKEENISRNIRHDYRSLDLRNGKNQKIFQIQTTFENGLRKYCIANDFVELHSPKIVGKTAESGSEVFKLDYFGEEASLSQSPQFYKQMAIASGFDKVFEIGPAFRAEKSNTNYHAAEINMCDMEIGWVDDINDIQKIEEEFLKTGFEEINSKHGNEIKNIFKAPLVNTDIPIPTINFYDAKKILKDKYNYISERPNDFDRKEELLLGKYVLENYKSEFVFIQGFPFESRAFYQQIDSDRNTKSYDLLFRGVEITTGALREHRKEILLNQIIEKGINPKELENYLELFDYGCPPHGGYGIGLSRILMKTLNIENIMDTCFIYRGASKKLKL